MKISRRWSGLRAPLNPMVALARRIGWGLAIVVGLLIATTILTARTGDPALWPPAAGSPTVEILVVSHGYHSGLALPRALVADVAERHGRSALIAVAKRFAAYPWIEVGWGDEGFYRSVPDAASFALAMRALFRPGNVSAVHVVGLPAAPRTIFPSADIVRAELSAEGFARLLDRLDASFARGADRALPEDLGPGLYGPSLFFRGVETFHAFNVCNHWVAALLAAAGLPIAPVLATLPQGLLIDLTWRSGLARLPRS